ncbi:MAG TPA: M20/M25/M40 family metallo-hydrolase [Longimicrobium sp.]|nr:M20/M25/M40 family metallo-hydrolase [Longimicrobium sp.]
MRVHHRPHPLALPVLAAALALAACTPASAPAPAPPLAAAPQRATEVREQDVREQLQALAADSMEGRGTGTPGGIRAARYLARRLDELGVQPAGDMGFLQVVPIAADPVGGRLRLMPSLDALAELPAGHRRESFNVIGMIPGSDPVLRHEAVIVGAHYDHVGIGRAVDGDSIYNGADDDASGSVAVLEIARALARGPAPRRTVVLFLATGEEVGMLGTRWYLQHPAVPIDSTVAGLFIEMIGRPDSLAGGPGRAWLTGYDRSSVGQILARAGVPVVPDPRPAQNFFERSDNTPFARLGVPAHAFSSFGLHTDYHRPSDEVERIDFAHLTRVVQAAVNATRALADGPRPEWAPGGRPAAAP